MTTRQTSGKPAKGRTAAQPRSAPARKAGSGVSVTKRQPAAGQRRGPLAPPPEQPAGLRGAWRRVLGWADGGLPLSALVVSLLGLADSTFLVYQHFSAATTFVGCSDKGGINCEAVTTSAWSYLPAGPVSWSVPVSVAGLAFFAFMVAVNSPWGWRAKWPVVHWARLICVVVGILLVLYLVWAELFRINAICLYCTGVHILTFILFALIVGKVAFSGVRPAPDKR